ncbi:AraC family transcriptional regulator [Orbus wheelerorum]|uniref:AraC family transcriptional regulator n=1 Tax=Orbus wheelerorum TaxID=3074111 RepID=UPI00370D4E6F
MIKDSRINPTKSWQILKDRILQITDASTGSYSTVIEGFSFHRHINNDDPKPHFFEPVVIIVVQGEKLVKIGVQEYLYGQNICFISGIDIPVTSCVMKASKDAPYLAMSLNLDIGLIASLASKTPILSTPLNTLPRGAMIQAVEGDLLDAFLRLIELTEKPEQIPIMKELLLQEIHYRLLSSPFGHTLRALNTFGSQGNQIARVIAWLKNNYKQPLQIEELAQRSNMAASTFHKHFKDVTSLSPIQYLKQLRLSEAQYLMLSKGYDVTQAAMNVGYESATQFIREYKRLFGEPPRKNITNIIKKNEFHSLAY